MSNATTNTIETASDVLWTYTDRSGVARAWTRGEQERHVSRVHEVAEILEAEGVAQRETRFAADA